MPNPDPIERLVRGFVEEANDLCESITRDVLALERGGADATPRYENTARSLHTLKGSAGTLGLTDLERLAHALETAVLPHAAGRQPLPSRDADALLTGLDAFMFRLRAHAEGREAELDRIEVLLRPFENAAQSSKRSVEPVQRLSEAPGAPEAPVVSGGPQTWRVAPEQVIALMGEVERLRFIRLRLEERRRDLTRARSCIASLWRGLDSSETQALITRTDVAIGSDAEEVANIVETIEQRVKDIGTEPIRVIVEPLHRAVRDLCRSNGKEAALSLVGGETCLDRRVLEVLKGPIVHLIRNAVAHGIEMPAVRRGRGKHEEGTIVIRVEQQGNVVFIEVSDDGEGLKADAIRRAALESRVATEAELATMQPEKLNRLIFLPTVSTAREVTATSGRGIGMDAVKKGIEEIDGQVEVQSIPEQGTRVLLTFPAGLGSSPILVVRVDEHDIGIPTMAVQSILAVKPANLVVGHAETRLPHGAEFLPVVDLSAALGLRPPRRVESGQFVLVHSQGQRVAVWVDEVVGDTDLTIRPLPREVAHLPHYQGAASLARGELVLVVRSDWLVGARAAFRPAEAGRHALVVDDSITARALHRSMLEVGGYRVHVAAGAAQALEQLTHCRYDVIVCDLTMSPVNGLEFVQMVRARPDTGDVPIIIVSAHGSVAARDQVLAAGANGFLSKAHCASGRLLDEVAQVVARRKGAA